MMLLKHSAWEPSFWDLSAWRFDMVHGSLLALAGLLLMALTLAVWILPLDRRDAVPSGTTEAP